MNLEVQSPCAVSMVDFGFSEALSVTQTVAIIAALVLTLYISRRALNAQRLDLETRVLNDLDEKTHDFVEIFVEHPELIRVIHQGPESQTAETGLAYSIGFMCSHIFHMRQRHVLSDNEWYGWHQWMKNAFRYGTISTVWKDTQMGRWFDPAFVEFVEREINNAASSDPTLS